MNGSRVLSTGQRILFLLAITWLIFGCSSPREATRVELELVVDSGGVQPVRTDLGYDVELTQARVVVENFEFTVGGEAHASRSVWEQVAGLVVRRASAHAGHLVGGEVTGELKGRHLVDWFEERPSQRVIGRANLLAQTYQGVNFTFGRGLTRAAPPEGESVPSSECTAVLAGRATKDSAVDFVICLLSPLDQKLTGATFQYRVEEDTDVQLGFRLNVSVEGQEQTLFDGVDFQALPIAAPGMVVIDGLSSDPRATEAYNLVRRHFQTSDHFDVRPFVPSPADD